MRIVTVVGARPQFIKAAAVSRVLRERHREQILHTGQHYDANMSEVFFQELSIPRPDFFLEAGSGSHGAQTARMLAGIEDILLREKPDAVLVYGDTNSTLAGALAAGKLLIPVHHVEAGLRSYNRAMPEEQNRVLTDHLATLLLCPTQTAVDNLRKEGLTQGVHHIGDVMCDAVHFYRQQMEAQPPSYYMGRLQGLFGRPAPRPERWYLATLHRAENTGDPARVRAVLDALNRLPHPVLFPVHPRVRAMVEQALADEPYHNLWPVEPVSYLTMLFLTLHAEKVITDSGGLQKEAYLLDTPCVTLRPETEWVETLRGNYNVLATPETLSDAVLSVRVGTEKHLPYYGDGHAARKLCDLLEENP